MKRISRACLTIGMALGLGSVHAQMYDPDEFQQIPSVTGMPFSAVGVQENAFSTPDGNHFSRKFTSHLYRNGEGSTRVERESALSSVVLSPDRAPRSMVMINNKSTGELITFMPDRKVADVFPGLKGSECPVSGPSVSAWFAGMRLLYNDPAWSAPVSLGEKSIEGVHVVGTQQVYTLSAGRVGNSKPVTVNVEQWSSPELGVIVDKTDRKSVV